MRRNSDVSFQTALRGSNGIIVISPTRAALFDRAICSPSSMFPVTALMGIVLQEKDADGKASGKAIA